MKILVNEKISQHKYKTPEGYLICVDSVLARTGNQTYRKNELFADSEDDSEIEVGRSPEEVFSAETLASFENKPITIEHPDEDVNIENYKDYAVGFVRDVKQGKFDGQDVILGTLVITDKDAIEGIENGEHVELSCGYDCDIEDGADGYQQKHIRGNHVALCEAGRAGIAKIIDSKITDDYVIYNRDEEEVFRCKSLSEAKKKIVELKRFDKKQGNPFDEQYHIEVEDSVEVKDEDEIRWYTFRGKSLAGKEKVSNTNYLKEKLQEFKKIMESKGIDPNDVIISDITYGDHLVSYRKRYSSLMKDSVEDAKKYAVEFVYEGDSISDYLGEVWVYANSEKEALKKAEQWANNEYDNAGHFKIVPKAYSNSPVIDAVETNDEEKNFEIEYLDHHDAKCRQTVPAKTAKEAERKLKEVLPVYRILSVKQTKDSTPDKEQTEKLEEDFEHFEDSAIDEFYAHYKRKIKEWSTAESKAQNLYETVIDDLNDLKRQSSTHDWDWDFSMGVKNIAKALVMKAQKEFKWIKGKIVDSTKDAEVNDAKEVRYQGYVIQEYHPLHDDPDGDGYIISKNGRIVGGADSIDEAIRKINRKELKRDSIKDDKLSTAKREIINWWKEVEKWNEKAGHPFNIENDYNNAYDLWSAMYDMYTESKLKVERPDLAKLGQRIYKKWEYDFNWTFNDSISDKDITITKELDAAKFNKFCDTLYAEYQKSRYSYSKGLLYIGKTKSSRVVVMIQIGPSKEEVSKTDPNAKIGVYVTITYDDFGSTSIKDWRFNSFNELKRNANMLIDYANELYEGTKFWDSVGDVNPRSGESKDDFIARFMKETKNEYPDEKQRFAVAYSYWERKGRDSMKDAKQTFEIRWIDQYQKSKGYDKSFWLNVDTIKADTATEALEKLKNIAVMRGIGTRYVTIVNIKSNTSNYQLSGNVDEVIRRLNDSKAKDAIGNRIIYLFDPDDVSIVKKLANKYSVKSKFVRASYAVGLIEAIFEGDASKLEKLAMEIERLTGEEFFTDSKPKDSIYALTVQGEKSKKLVRAKDAREAIDKYTRMFPKYKISSVKKTDKFNKIIGLIKR